MANVKITELTAYTDPASTDVVPIVDLVSDQTKKVTVADLLENAGAGSASAAAFAFDGDSDTGMYRSGANSLAFTTGGTGRLFIDSSGNVLFGKTSQNLATAGFQHRGDAIGLVQITRDSGEPLQLNRLTNDGKLIEFRQDTTAIGSISVQGSDLGIDVNGNERVRIDSSGRLLVGTSSATTGKVVISHSNELGLHTTGPYNFQAKFESTDAEAGIVIQDSNSTDDGNRIGVIGDNMAFTTANTERMRITSVGDVQARRARSNTSGDVALSIQPSDTTLHYGFRVDQTNNNLNLDRVDNSSTLLTVGATGNIGIGTTAATDKLNISSATNQIGLDTGDQSTYGTLDVGHFTNGAFIGTQAGTNAAADVLRLGTSGTTKLQINSNGNVGIGTTSASKVLTVKNADPVIRFEDTGGGAVNLDANAGSFVIDADPTNSTGSTTIQFKTDGAERARLDSNGRLGIGITSPLGAMHVKGSDPQLYLEDSAGGPGGKLRSIATDNGVMKFIRHLDDGTVAGEHLSILANGNIGIGTTAATGNLHVKGSTLVLEPSSVAVAHRIGFSTADLLIEADVGNSAASNIVFRNDASEQARIDSSGRLLVGTSSARSNYRNSIAPTIQLEETSDKGLCVFTNINASSGPYIWLGKSRGTSVGSSTIVQDNDVLGSIRFNGADGSDVILAASVRAEVDGTPGAGDMPGRLVFSTTADGASSPTERLKIVNNGVLFSVPTYTATTASAANVNVQSNGGLQRSTSSAKYKTNIETLQNSYADALLNCRPVWYRSTCPGDNPRHGWWGFIAEEVAEIDPRLVLWKTTEPVVQEDGSLNHVDCDPEPEGVAYDRFVPHLLNLIKRQQQAIETLEAKVAVLEAG